MLRTINLTKIVPIRPIQYGVGLFKAPIKEETEDKIPNHEYSSTAQKTGGPQGGTIRS